MSIESKNNWRLLHELVLKAKAAKDFETLGRAIEQLSAIMKEFPPCFDQGRAESYFQSACGKAIKCMTEKLIDWQENPPPIRPGDPQPVPPSIGPGNPFPIPPPPPPTVAHGEWTGALVFERIAPQGLTNPVGYRAATPEEQAELDRIARAINRNPPLFDPKPQAPGSLDELRKTIICAITNEKEAVNGQYGGADVGLLLNALVRMVDKAFAAHAAQNAKAIEEAAEPLRAPKPWTGESMWNKLCSSPGKDYYPWDRIAPFTREMVNDLASVINGQTIERAAEPVRTPEPWTGESFYAAYALAHERACGWADLSAEGQSEWNRIAGIANERMGSAPSPLKPWTAEEFYLQFGQPLGRLGTVASVRLSSAQREACEKAAAVINKWAGLGS